jgi:hypothetical protein
MIAALLITIFANSQAVQPPPPAPVNLDSFKLTVEDPELKPWGEKAQKLIAEWYPKICDILGVADKKPVKAVTLVIETHGKGIAGTGGRRITVNGDYVRKHEDDIGLVVHELAHVVQSYPKYDPSWLVEGIADYVRFFNYEPVSARPNVNPDRADYKRGYRDVGAFLDWACRTYDKNLVKKLNTALHEGTYTPEIWEKTAGKSFDALWTDYLESLRPKP